MSARAKSGLNRTQWASLQRTLGNCVRCGERAWRTGSDLCLKHKKIRAGHIHERLEKAMAGREEMIRLYGEPPKDAPRKPKGRTYSVRDFERLAMFRDEQAEKRKQRAKDGVCVQCGEPVWNGKARCRVHHEKHLATAMRFRERASS